MRITLPPRFLGNALIGLLCLLLLLIPSAAQSLFAQATGSIGDFVWVEFDDDDVQTFEELGVEDVEVRLYRDDDASGDVSTGDTFLDSTTTDSDGAYLFDQLAADDYVVSIPVGEFLVGQPLEEMELVSPFQGADPLLDSNAIQAIDGSVYASATVGAGEDLPGIDFGLQPIEEGGGGIDYTIGDLVWLDLTPDGVHDPSSEPGLPGVELILFGDEDGSGDLSNGDTFIATTQTLGGNVQFLGTYFFLGPGAGDYLVALSDANFEAGGALEGYEQSATMFAPDSGDGFNKASPYSTTLPDDLSCPKQVQGVFLCDPTADFGIVPLDQGGGSGDAALGNLVFSDVNRNGRYDPGFGEFGIDHVELSLFVDVDGSGDLSVGDGGPIASTVTTALGRYRFEGLANGDYIVRVDASNFEPGGVLIGTVSSDANDVLGLAPDPDDDVDDDDNGSPSPLGGVSSQAITLAAGTEPPVGGDGSDSDSNDTLDFGFQQPESPTAGLLNEFSAVVSEGRVKLTWATPVEIDVSGFHVIRGRHANDEGVRLNEVLIEAVGAGSRGSTYVFEDAPEAGTWNYHVAVVHDDGRVSRSRPATAIVFTRPLVRLLLPWLGTER